jgi:hypothetical protein
VDHVHWKQPTSHNDVARRNAGRRRYNAYRQREAAARRLLLATFANGLGINLFDWGAQAELARALGHHRSTISRDITIILDTLNHNPRSSCRICWHRQKPCSACAAEIRARNPRVFGKAR